MDQINLNLGPITVSHQRAKVQVRTSASVQLTVKAHGAFDSAFPDLNAFACEDVWVSSPSSLRCHFAVSFDPLLQLATAEQDDLLQEIGQALESAQVPAIFMVTPKLTESSCGDNLASAQILTTGISPPRYVETVME